ncbi:LysM peptidoglycan-binding domain-containing protein [Paracidovorax avenae]|uniref:LysM peptidoglycan-binding domain-containing protein n=1 Tax=Paracidovorax avenae TaxID=80867 RepID=UPI0018651639|nr:LysM peptidoglycan-binding domain-containing protein [Paracidovorax avenae]
MRYRYDAQGRKVGQTDAMGMTQAWNYDIFGHLIGRTDAQSGGGAPVDFNFTYNLAGQLVHEDNTRVEPGVGGAAAINKKKNIDYRYDGAGQLIEIRDNYLGQTTRYEYDLGGNRVAEKMSQKTLLTSGLLDDVVYQDNHLVYDAQHRLRAVFDGRSDVRITYDLAGNRDKVATHVINTIRTSDKNTGLQERQVVHTSTTDFRYDDMNRQTWSRESSSVDGSITTQKYFYDLAGNRTLAETYSGPPIAKTDTTPEQPDGKMQKSFGYVYDDLHRVTTYWAAGESERIDDIRYDGAGRQVYGKSLAKSGSGWWTDEHRYNRYDATGKLQDVHVVMRDVNQHEVKQRSDVAYHDAGGVTDLGYDAAGNLKGVRQVTDGNNDSAVTTTYKYAYLNGSYQQSAAVTRRSGTVVGTITQRDANGFVVGIRQPKLEGSAAQGSNGSLAAALMNPAVPAQSNEARYDRTFVNDANGTAVFVSQGGFNAQGEVNSSIANPASGYQGGVTGSALTPGHVQRQLVANGEVLARYGDAPTTETDTEPSNNPVYVDTADFRLRAPAMKLKNKSLDPVAYTVVGGETLKDIARNVLGDASLWWRIADANSLAVSGDGQLTAGQTLTVPKLSLNANSVETFQPYDPSQATGSMDPVLPVPENKGGGCGGLGKIIVMVVTIVVAAITQQYYLMNYGASLLAAGAVGGAAGSIAGQAVGNVLGVQNGFSWKSVAMSAIAGGVSGGLAESSFLGGTGFQETVVRAAVGNAMTQGIGVVTGLQDRFDWKAVVGSAVGAGVGWGMNEALDLTDANGKTTGRYGGLEKLARASLSGIAAGTATAVMRGGRISIQQVATDAFGNALGNSLAYAMQPEAVLGTGLKIKSSTADSWGPKYRFDDVALPTDYSLVGGGSVRLGTGYVDEQTAASDESQFRQEQLARIMRLANAPEALGFAGTPHRIEMTRTRADMTKADFEATNRVIVDTASQNGEDLAPTMANAARLRLESVSGGLSGVELAQRFGRGLLGAVKAVTIEPVLQTRDMGMALFSVAYNDLLRSNGDAQWFPEMKSGTAQAYDAGASQARLLLQSNPFTGLGVASYDLTTASMNRDWGAVAEMGGGVLGGFALGKATSAYGKYGVRWAPGEIGSMPMSSQRGATSLLNFELVKPGGSLPEGLAYRLDLPEHLAGPDGFTKSGQLSGTHNLDNATAALDAKGATYSLTPTGTAGISELSYSYVKSTSGKIITGSKTVYDPAVFSDQTMLDYSLSAGQQGWSRYLSNPTTTSFDITHGGVNFRTYINVDQRGNPYIGNVHPIK